MPEKLRRHEFKRLLPAEAELPPPTLDFWDREACKAFNYPGYGAWLTEDVTLRAQCIAHEMAKRQREAYAQDVMANRPRDSENTVPAVAPWDVVMQSMFRPQMPK